MTDRTLAPAQVALLKEHGFGGDETTKALLDWLRESAEECALLDPAEVYDEVFALVHALTSPPAWNYQLDGYVPQEGDWWFLDDGSGTPFLVDVESAEEWHHHAPAEVVAYYRPPGPPPVPGKETT